MGEITIYREFQQGTSYWKMCRMGMPTASKFGTVMAKGRGSAESKTRDRYMDELVAELYTGNPYEGYRNAYMDAGNMMEEEARIAYLAGHDCQEINYPAFVRNNQLHCGASPDMLIGDVGGVEIKTLIPPLMVRLLLNPSVPPEHIPQIQGLMWVTGRSWWDCFIYCPGFRPFYQRVDRNDAYITDLAREVQLFNQELEGKVLRLLSETLTSRRRLLDRRLAERLEEDRAMGDLETAPVPA